MVCMESHCRCQCRQMDKQTDIHHQFKFHRQELPSHTCAGGLKKYDLRSLVGHHNTPYFLIGQLSVVILIKNYVYEIQKG